MMQKSKIYIINNPEKGIIEEYASINPITFRAAIITFDKKRKRSVTSYLRQNTEYVTDELIAKRIVAHRLREKIKRCQTNIERYNKILKNYV